jgi:phosphatidate cytidylyltransferase
VSGKSELAIRLILGPSMLAIIALVYYFDSQHMGNQRGILSAIVLGLIGVGGLLEFVAMFRAAGNPLAVRLLLVAGISLFSSAFLFMWGNVDRELYPLVSITMLLLFPVAVISLRSKNMHRGLEMQGATLLAFILIAWPMYLAQGMAIRHLPSLLFVILVCKGGDIGGYLLGIAMGKRKLIPHISAGKTIEGALGSMLASVGLAILLTPMLLEPTVQLGGLTGMVLIGIMLNVTTQCGDLIESLLKRRCEVKDSSTMLPAHGGVLDLIDSLLFSFPAFFLVLTALT